MQYFHGDTYNLYARRRRRKREVWNSVARTRRRSACRISRDLCFSSNKFFLCNGQWPDQKKKIIDRWSWAFRRSRAYNQPTSEHHHLQQRYYIDHLLYAFLADQSITTCSARFYISLCEFGMVGRSISNAHVACFVLSLLLAPSMVVWCSDNTRWMINGNVKIQGSHQFECDYQWM